MVQVSSMDEFVDPVLVHCKAMTEKVPKEINILYCKYLTNIKPDKNQTEEFSEYNN